MRMYLPFPLKLERMNNLWFLLPQRPQVKCVIRADRNKSTLKYTAIPFIILINTNNTMSTMTIA